jgi:hypothetical protein
MSRYLVPFNDLPETPLPVASKQIAKQAQQANEKTGLETYKYELGVGARSRMAQADFEAHQEAGHAAMSKEIEFLKDGLAKTGGSAAAAEIVGGWVADVRHADQRRFRHFFGV